MADETPPAPVSAVPRRRRWLRLTIRVIGWGLFAVALLVAIGVTTLNTLGRRAAERLTGDFRARGLPTSIEEAYGDAKANDTGRKFRSALALAGADLEHYERKYAAVDADPSTEEGRRLMAEVLAEQELTFRLLEEACAGEPAVYRLRISRQVEDISVLADARTAERLLVIRARYQRGTGRADDALRTLGTALEVNRSLARDPWAIVALVRVSIIAMLQEEIEEALGRSYPGPEALAELRDRLVAQAESFDRVAVARIELAWACESARTIDLQQTAAAHLVERYRADEHKWDAMRGTYPMEVSSAPGLWRSRLARAWAAICPGQEQKVLAAMAQDNVSMLDLARLSPDSYAAKLKTVPAGDRGADHSAFQNILWAQTRCLLAAETLAVERHRILTGAWPAAGDTELAARDPMTGQPFRLTHTDDGCVVYSLGADLDDDGGRSTGDRRWEDGDWTFKLLDPAKRAAARPSTQPGR